MQTGDPVPLGALLTSAVVEPRLIGFCLVPPFFFAPRVFSSLL